jgi:hypothetical protein
MEYDADPEAAVRKWVHSRLAYHQRVVTYFARRPFDFLIINICDGADSVQAVQTITRFLDLETTPGVALPRQNVHESTFHRPDVPPAARSKSEVRVEVERILSDIGLMPEQQSAMFP